MRGPDFAGWRTTLAESLLLGIRESLSAGERDLGWFERLEAGVPIALVVYDTMPGGTDHLPKLLAHECDSWRAAIGVALQHLESCTCDASCHRCLRDFWNQRHHAVLDRFLVVGALRRLADLDPATGIGPDDARLESFLEEEFYARLDAAGLPAPTLQVIGVVGGRRIIRVDAEYRSPDVSIFLDGRSYHAMDQAKIIDDLEVRNRLEGAGVLVLEYTYHAVLERFGEIAAQIASALAGAPPPTNLPLSLPGLTVLEVDKDTCRCNVEVDASAWVADETARQRSLDAANRLRLAGWRLHGFTNAYGSA